MREQRWRTDERRLTCCNALVHPSTCPTKSDRPTEQTTQREREREWSREPLAGRQAHQAKLILRRHADANRPGFRALVTLISF